jgi:hypothetical protein
LSPWNASGASCLAGRIVWFVNWPPCTATNSCKTGSRRGRAIRSREVTGDHELCVTFDDGAVRELSLAGQLDGPVFEPLRDPALFAQVTVDSESGTVTWPTGADLDPVVIYEGLPPLRAKAVDVTRRA